MAAKLNVEMPIAQEVYNALFEGKSVQRCLIDLLSRESKDELADFQRWIDRLNVTD
jgi:glycerol-3-phosphate dehydrogenase